MENIDSKLRNKLYWIESTLSRELDESLSIFMYSELWIQIRGKLNTQIDGQLDNGMSNQVYQKINEL